MANKNSLKRIMATVCFECCHTDFRTGGTRKVSRRPGQHPELGEQVELEGRCKGCPIGALRGDGAPISKGQESAVFKGQLVPGKECVTAPLTVEDLWRPCEKCPHAEMKGDTLKLKDLFYCLSQCPARELLDSVSEACAEAAMS